MAKRLDKLQQAFGDSAKQYDCYAAVQAKMAEELLQRLVYFTMQPQRIVDLGAGTGGLTKGLRRCFPKSDVWGVDIAVPMLHQLRQAGITGVCGDVHRLPLQDHSVDMLTSNAMLQWSYDLPQLLRECARVLNNNGLFLFATFGTDTLKELRLAWQEVDTLYPHVNPFMDMHELGDSLMRCGFVNPVMDVQIIQLEYSHWRYALQDVRGVGSRNHLRDRRRSLTGVRRWEKMVKALQECSTKQGKIVMTYEVVYGHAFKGEPQAPKQQQPFFISPASIGLSTTQ